MDFTPHITRPIQTVQKRLGFSPNLFYYLQIWFCFASLQNKLVHFGGILMDQSTIRFHMSCYLLVVYIFQSVSLSVVSDWRMLYVTGEAGNLAFCRSCHNYKNLLIEQPQFTDDSVQLWVTLCVYVLVTTYIHSPQLYVETRPPVIWTGKNKYGRVEIWWMGNKRRSKIKRASKSIDTVQGQNYPLVRQSVHQ